MGLGEGNGHPSVDQKDLIPTPPTVRISAKNRRESQILVFAENEYAILLSYLSICENLVWNFPNFGFFGFIGLKLFFTISIKNRPRKWQWIALWSLIFTIYWHKMLLWTLPNMSGVVLSLFGFFRLLQMTTHGQKVMKKHWRPDFILDFGLLQSFF